MPVQVAPPIVQPEATSLPEKIKKLSDEYSQKLTAVITNPEEMMKLTGNRKKITIIK